MILSLLVTLVWYDVRHLLESLAQDLMRWFPMPQRWNGPKNADDIYNWKQRDMVILIEVFYRIHFYIHISYICLYVFHDDKSKYLVYIIMRIRPYTVGIQTQILGGYRDHTLQPSSHASRKLLACRSSSHLYPSGATRIDKLGRELSILQSWNVLKKDDFCWHQTFYILMMVEISCCFNIKFQERWWLRLKPDTTGLFFLPPGQCQEETYHQQCLVHRSDSGGHPGHWHPCRFTQISSILATFRTLGTWVNSGWKASLAPKREVTHTNCCVWDCIWNLYEFIGYFPYFLYMTNSN